MFQITYRCDKCGNEIELASTGRVDKIRTVCDKCVKKTWHIPVEIEEVTWTS